MVKPATHSQSETVARPTFPAFGDGESNGAFANGGSPGAAPHAAESLIAGKQAMARMMMTGQEMSRFVVSRLKKDARAMAMLASCRSSPEFTATWFSHISEAVHDYADEFDRIVSIGREDAPAKEKL